ncbi:hypothetical protein SAMN04515621_0668 [Erythrobacter sp. HL-111]|nr:MAG: hypothetical protein HLUCCO15_13125 [Erythrobacteraceae bacterium HL-111]SDR93777.1 hypothetical protein SAMN04515621_0668 [Erythrobacter sp. HL-111]
MAGDRRISRPDASLPDWEVPDTAYRPIPIVWFTGAMLVQLAALTLVSVALSGVSGWFTIAAGGLASGAIFRWTWERGMKRAGNGWRAATALVMLAQLGFLCLAVLPRV